MCAPADGIKWFAWPPDADKKKERVGVLKCWFDSLTCPLWPSGSLSHKVSSFELHNNRLNAKQNGSVGNGLGRSSRHLGVGRWVYWLQKRPMWTDRIEGWTRLAYVKRRIVMWSNMRPPWLGPGAYICVLLLDSIGALPLSWHTSWSGEGGGPMTAMHKFSPSSSPCGCYWFGRGSGKRQLFPVCRPRQMRATLRRVRSGRQGAERDRLPVVAVRIINT